MAVTGIVHTKNEERDIERAIRSLRPLCDEVLVADMASTDRTAAIAVELGARVIDVPDFGYVEPAWALALEHVDTEWVLRIDADEIVPASLAERLRRIVTSDEGDVAYIGRRNFMFGEPLVGTGWAPESDLHYFLFKPQFLDSPGSADTAIHTVVQPTADARVVTVPPSEDLSVWHFNYLDWHQFVDKMNRYTTIEASELRGGGGSFTFAALARQAALQLAWRGVRRGAWRDGYRGAGLLWMMTTYRALVYLKARQLAERGDRATIAARYDSIAAEAIAL